MGEFALGQPVPRFEDPRLLRGGGRYVDDMVLPRMAFGYVLRSPHAHARIRGIDTRAAKAAPGVLAVLTGADWAASGWGDLPVPSGLEGATARRCTGRAFRRWSRTGCAGSAITSPLSSPRPRHQAADAAELIEVDYEPLPAIVSTAGAVEPGAPLRLGRLARTTSAFVHPEGRQGGDRGRASPRRRMSSSAVSSSTASPPRRWSRAARSATTTRPRTATRSTPRCSAPTATAPSWRRCIKVPESQVRVVAGDIGGSFGMKSAIYNEVALVLLASKMLGRPVKWTSTRSEAFLCDAQARDHVTEAELALDKDGHFLGFRVKTTAAVGAYRAGRLQCLRR